VDIQKVWLLFSSVVLAFAFVFGNSIRQLYEAVIFLFVIHPFDVGDWLLIGANQYQASP
jgi:small-conductance mechanosensitive channel